MFLPLVMDEFGNQTVLGFWVVQEHALRHKAGRTGRKVEDLIHHEWSFYCFCLSLCLKQLYGQLHENYMLKNIYIEDINTNYHELPM